jgi:hypothetical protein
MATQYNIYQLLYFNPDGSWSHLLGAHWDAKPFVLNLQTGILLDMEDL